MESRIANHLAESIADGRIGRSFLARLAGVEPHLLTFALRLEEAEHPNLIEKVQDAASRWLTEADEVSDRQIFSLFGDFVNSYPHGLESGWRDFDVLLAACRSELTQVAQNLAARPGLHWWSHPVDREHQYGYLHDGAAGTHTAASVVEGAAAALNQSSVWWVSPGHTLTTSRGPVFGSACVVAGATDDHWLLNERDSLWSVHVDGEARVFEVHSRDDWSDLVTTYPYAAPNMETFGWGDKSSTSAQLLIPNWAEVAKDWDGVHVSVAGYLNAAYTPISLRPGRYALLAGWHPDGTVWLTDKAQSGGQRIISDMT